MASIPPFFNIARNLSAHNFLLSNKLAVRVVFVDARSLSYSIQSKYSLRGWIYEETAAVS
jgi:hypothetical protein